MYKIFLLLLSVLLLTGCLTVETKEYIIKLKTATSGEATIRFTNIFSETDDSVDVSTFDFQQLIETYLDGNKIEKESPGYRNVKKRLYENKGVLVGEITFTFDSLSVLRMFKFDKDSPYMYFAGTSVSSEQLVESNGTIGEQWMPIVFWPKESREFYVKTRVTSEGIYKRSLLKQFQDWKATQSKNKKQK